MNPSTVRVLAARAVVGGAVAGLLLLPGSSAPHLLPGIILSWTGLSSLAVLGWIRWRPFDERTALGMMLVLDLAPELLLVAGTGLGRSPFASLFSLTIAAAGTLFGFAGGLTMGFLAAAGYWILVQVGQGSGIPPVLTGILLLILGLLFGRLGGRMARQSEEMERVQVELERVQMDAETIVASLGGPLLCLDRHGEIRRVNHAAVRLLRLEHAADGVRLTEAGDPARLAPLLQFVGEAFRGGEHSAEIELPAGAGNPDTPIEVTSSCVRDRDGRVQGLVLVLNDLTRRREQEAEQARQERLAVVGELSGHLAHEIRNSLKPVVGSIELLAGEIPREGTSGELLEIILRESESLETFLTDFLSFARDKSLTIEPFALDELIGEQIATLAHHPAHRTGVVLRFEGDSEDATVESDRNAVRDILRNLVLNALEATTQGEVVVHVRSHGNDLEVVVEDTGEGLPEGDPELLFEPFRSHKPGGTGLGLAITRRLAGRLGVEVALEPREGGGARARLSLRGLRCVRRAA
jgi:signal transduction histidine kinase